jgi:hypothetical protein
MSISFQDSHCKHQGALGVTYTHPDTDYQQAFVCFEVSGFVGGLVDWVEVSDKVRFVVVPVNGE